MQQFESLIAHLEKLDEQLASYVDSPGVGDGKLVKEVLFARLETCRYVQHHSHALEGTPLADRAAKLKSGKLYNIDRLNERYCRTVACPACNTTEVAVIKKLPVQSEMTYDLHNNPRLRLVVHDPHPAAGKFVCKSCLSRFTPSLPPHHVKLCEMLFAYYN